MGQQSNKEDLEADPEKEAAIHVPPEVLKLFFAAGAKGHLCPRKTRLNTDPKAGLGSLRSGKDKDNVIHITSDALGALLEAGAPFRVAPNFDAVLDVAQEETIETPRADTVRTRRGVTSPRPRRYERPYEVTCHVYDTFWLTALLNVPAFHLGVEVLGTEFSFGDMGININRPGEYEAVRHRCALKLGHTFLEDREVLQALRELQLEWPGECYRLNGRNCQTFAVALSERLGLPGSIPDEYIGFSEPLLAPWQCYGSGFRRTPVVPKRTKISL